jgi:hypothetical protein
MQRRNFISMMPFVFLPSVVETPQYGFRFIGKPTQIKHYPIDNYHFIKGEDIAEIRIHCYGRYHDIPTKHIQIAKIASDVDFSINPLKSFIQKQIKNRMFFTNKMFASLSDAERVEFNHFLIENKLICDVYTDFGTFSKLNLQNANDEVRNDFRTWNFVDERLSYSNI